MKTYVADKHPAETTATGTREWVFGLLPTRRYRERCDQLSALELRRRPDCEPTLRALVLDEWTPETYHHIGWCDSCRTAGFALGMGGPRGVAHSAPRRRRALWLALAAGVAIAAPIAGSQLIDNPFGSQDVRGGVAITVRQAPPPPQVVPVPRSRPAVTPAVGHERSAITERGQRALPLTT
jgi:hypothetical protein